MINGGVASTHQLAYAAEQACVHPGLGAALGAVAGRKDGELSR